MQVDVYTPLLVSLFLGLLAPTMTSWLPPAAAVRLLVLGAIACAASWLWTLALLASTAVGQLRFVAAEGHWSRAALRASDPVAGVIAWAAAVALVAAVGLLLTVSVRRLRTAWSTRRAAAQLCHSHPGELVVLPDAMPQAYAVPGKEGRIVVSTAMLRALPAAERRVLFAHERAHLHGRHHLWLLAVQLAAAANPLLTRVLGAVEFGLERWADETAARTVGDRRLAAAALCRAGLATLRAGADRPAGAAISFATGRVPARVRALLAEPIPIRWLLVVTIAAIVVLGAAAAIDAGREAENLFELAINAYRAGSPA